MKKSNYMADVEMWLDTKVFPAITKSHANADAFAIQMAYKGASNLIKDKLLESYRNGRKPNA